MDDDEFLAILARAATPHGAFPAAFRFGHREHLRLAWLSVRRDGRERGAERVIAGIRRVAAAHGASEKYHETITRFWIRLVDLHIAEEPAIADFDAFLARHSRLADLSLMRRHYRPETLASERARREWVEPDLIPLPA